MMKSMLVVVLVMFGWGELVGATSGSAVAASSPYLPVATAPATSTLYVGESADALVSQNGGIGVFDPNNLAAGPSSVLPPVSIPQGVGGFTSVVLVGTTLVGLADTGHILRRFNTLTGSSVDQTLSASTPLGPVFRLAASPDASTLYLVGDLNGALQISAMDTFTWTVTKQMTVSLPGQHADTSVFPTVDPETGDLWIPGGDVVVVDPSTWTSRIILTNMASGQVAFVGGDAWVPVNQTLLEVSTSDFSTVRTIALPGVSDTGSAGAAAATPGAADVYVTATGVGSNGVDVDVFAISVATGVATDIGTVAEILDGVFPTPAPMVVSADGSTVFVGVNSFAWTAGSPYGQVSTIDTATNTVAGNTGSTGSDNASSSPYVTALVPAPTSPSPTQGYWEVASDGGVFSFGDAAFHGSMGGTPLNRPVVGIAAGPGGRGYWEVASDGGVFAFGDAAFYGSMGGRPLNRPIVGIASTPDGKGYWEVASDGGIFAFGDAAFHGSMGGRPLNRPIVGIASTPDGKGYWEVASDGGIFAFGDAAFHGSMGGRPLDRPVVGVATDTSTGGYWIVADDGGIFAFDAPFYGSPVGAGLAGPVLGMAATAEGSGYWVLGAGGALGGFGDAGNYGSMGGTPLNQPIVGMGTTGSDT